MSLTLKQYVTVFGNVIEMQYLNNYLSAHIGENLQKEKFLEIIAGISEPMTQDNYAKATFFLSKIQLKEYIEFLNKIYEELPE